MAALVDITPADDAAHAWLTGKLAGTSGGPLPAWLRAVLTDAGPLKRHVSMSQTRARVAPAIRCMVDQITGEALPAGARGAFWATQAVPVQRQLQVETRLSGDEGVAVPGAGVLSGRVLLAQMRDARRSVNLNLETTTGHGTAVAGRVSVLFDADGRPLPARRGMEVVAVSVPGVNMAYGRERAEFAQSALALEARYAEIWGHALEVMASRGVRVASLGAIGCGAFGCPPAIVGRALLKVLVAGRASGAAWGFDAVVVCLPSFGDRNYEAFCESFASGPVAGRLRQIVALVPCCGIAEVAVAASCAGRLGGLLNPSDDEAVLDGAIGMNWDCGHVALEEVLAVTTTLLVHHRQLNPALWDDPSRTAPVRVRLGRDVAAQN